MNSLFVSGLIALSLLVALPAGAQDQDQFSKVELYGGYSYVHFSVTANVVGFPRSVTANANGGGGELEYNANRWLGIVGDLSGYYVANPQAGVFTYMAGPRLNLRSRRVTPFAHILFGGVVATEGIGPGSNNAFAMATGGGLDIAVSRHVSLRPAQLEYYMTKFPDGLNDRQNNFRFGAGIVLRFGGK